jgi:hypothetical protein
MTFIEHLAKSVDDPRILVEIDISKLNTQWVNLGGGIWWLAVDADYSEYVDATLDNCFSAQTFNNIASVICNGLNLSKVASLILISTTERSFYWDGSNNLYARFLNNDEPSIMNIWLGIVYGYSFNEFTPLGATKTYEGRLESIPRLTKKRDPLYFGKIAFDGGSIVLKNNDGNFDTFAIDNDVYGNECRIKFGYDGMDYDDYVTIYKSYIGRLDITEDTMVVNLDDKRKQFARPITYSCTNKNALDAIVEIIQTEYPYINYSSVFYNTTEWAAATLLVSNVTINMQNPKPAIDVIQEICASVFGIFDVQVDGRFTFKVIDTSAIALSTIVSIDINNKHSISFDPGEVISSVRVSYDIDGNVESSNYRTWLTDISVEETVFLKYKTYNQKDFETWLVNSAAAQTFATKILNYVKDVHGTFSINVPMRYYDFKIGDLRNVEIERETTTMLGTKKCEVMGISYDLNGVPSIDLDMRIV